MSNFIEVMEVLNLEIHAQEKVLEYWTKKAQEDGDDISFQYLDRARYAVNLLQEVRYRMVLKKL